jgi:hypothetical protein
LFHTFAALQAIGIGLALSTLFLIRRVPAPSVIAAPPHLVAVRKLSLGRFFLALDFAKAPPHRNQKKHDCRDKKHLLVNFRETHDIM